MLARYDSVYWRLVSLLINQQMTPCLLLLLLRALPTGSAKGVFVLPEGANTPLLLGHVLKLVAKQSKEIADKLQQQHKLVCGYLEEVRCHPAHVIDTAKTGFMCGDVMVPTL